MTTSRYEFRDPITGAQVALVIPPNGVVFPMHGEAKIGVEHPGCSATADLVLMSDAFYCPRCKWNGRVSGAWALTLIDTSDASQEQPLTTYAPVVDANAPKDGHG